MTVYATKAFFRFASKAGLNAAQLLDAATAVMEGRFDADLGGNVFKQRVAREGGGKSGGFRTILIFKVGSHCFFAHGFAKSAKANVSARDLMALKGTADALLGLSVEDIEAAVGAGAILEVTNDEGNETSC